jgi:hypothetical protein
MRKHAGEGKGTRLRSDPDGLLVREGFLEQRI